MAKELIISDEHRTNELSLLPGGSVVKVIQRDGKIYVYDKIKDPARYIARMDTSKIQEIWVNEELYARTEDDEDEAPWH
jgi:hypothetical protein